MRFKKILIACIPLIYLLFLLFEKDLSLQTDLGRHLKLGEIVVHCLCVPQTNLFSYTYPNFPIVQHEWLAEVVFYLVSVAVGLNGLLVFKMLLVLATATLLYIVALKKGSQFWVTIFSLLGITVFSSRFFVLPELFSYLFISIYIFIIESYKRSQNMKYLFVLPFLEILWVNMHLYFILGISMYGLFFLEELIRTKRVNKNLVLIGAGLIIATFINPGTYKGAILPFTFSSNYNFNVEENQSPFIILNPTTTNGNVAYTLVLQIFMFDALLVLVACCLFITYMWKKNFFQLGNGITGAVLGIKFYRCLPLIGLMGFIPLVQSFTNLEEKVKHAIEISMRNSIKGVIFLVTIGIVMVHINGLFAYQILDFGYAPSAQNAVAFIKAAHIQGRIFNNYIVGNYLIYGLYPQEKVFIDARPEAYPGSLFDDYYHMLKDPTYFASQVKRYDINAVVFDVADDDPAVIRPFLISLLSSNQWVPVYGDGIVSVFVRNNRVNSYAISHYRIAVSGQ